MKKKYNGDVELALRSMVGSFALEGMSLTPEEIAINRGILNGEIDPEEHIRSLVAKYKEAES